MVIQATDQAGNKSFLQMVSIVSGEPQPGVVGDVQTGYSWSPALRLAWQLMALAAVAVLAFWLGEKREARLLKSGRKLS